MGKQRICARLRMWICTLLLAVFATSVSCVSRHHDGPVTDHFDGRRFFNPTPFEKKSLWSVLRWQILGDKEEWPEKVENLASGQPATEVSPDEIVVTFINHATLLIQLSGINILTDPIWSKRASPLTWLGPKRVREPGLDFDRLPQIDVVLISHNHYDHMDEETLRRLDKKFSPLFLVALGDKTVVKKMGLRNVQELDWWQTVTVRPELTIVFTPAQHWSGRGLFDRHLSLWGSFTLLHGPYRIHFGGDAGYSRHYSDIRERLGEIDIAFLPIGAYEPRWFMKDSHMNPEEAVQAHLDLRSKRSIGIHFGAFQLTDEGIDDPVNDLRQALGEFKLPASEFSVLQVGETLRHSLKR